MARNNIDVLIIVDALGASQDDGGLGSNVYLVDTNKHLGSSQEGQAELSTACNDGQKITWNITPIDPSNDVAITGFTGQMVTDGVCRPHQLDNPGGGQSSLAALPAGSSTQCTSASTARYKRSIPSSTSGRTRGRPGTASRDQAPPTADRSAAAQSCCTGSAASVIACVRHSDRPTIRNCGNAPPPARRDDPGRANFASLARIVRLAA